MLYNQTPTIDNKNNTHFIENHFVDIHKDNKNKWFITLSKIPIAFLPMVSRLGGGGGGSVLKSVV
jgi:hypothetical protein